MKFQKFGYFLDVRPIPPRLNGYVVVMGQGKYPLGTRVLIILSQFLTVIRQSSIVSDARHPPSATDAMRVPKWISETAITFFLSLFIYHKLFIVVTATNPTDI